MDKYVLDTNLFFNMEPGLGIGKKTQEVVEKTTTGIKRLKDQGKAEFYMPPRVVEEFLSFFDDKEQSFIKELLSVVSVKSPHVTSVSFPADVFYRLVEDVRKRSYNGLKAAEDTLKTLAKQPKSTHETKQAFEQSIGPLITNLRNRYRTATRVGFIDSLADLDLIVLSKELEATLVSSDEGVVYWGRIFGVREMDPQTLGKLLIE